MPVLPWDIRNGPEFDLLQPHLVALILGWCKAGLLVGAHVAPPCNTFSQARRGACGPRAMRSAEHPMGIPGEWSAAEARQIQEGTRLAHAAATIFEQAVRNSIPVTLENPLRSLLWALPEYVGLRNRRDVAWSCTEMCMWGAPWRKPTAFLSANVCLRAVSEQRCARTALCSRTGRPHMVLSGRDARGAWRTAAAARYPWALCESLAMAFQNARVSRQAANFSKLVGVPGNPFGVSSGD